MYQPVLTAPMILWNEAHRFTKEIVSSASPPGIATDYIALQRVVRKAQYITGAKLPAIQDLQLKLEVYIHLSQLHLNSSFLQFLTFNPSNNSLS
jgi:hypothetical protein